MEPGVELLRFLSITGEAVDSNSIEWFLAGRLLTAIVSLALLEFEGLAADRPEAISIAR